MGRSERNEYFERLVAMRDGYGASADDRAAVLAVDDAVRYAEAVMTAVEHDDEPWHAEIEETAAYEAREARESASLREGRHAGDVPHLPRFASDLWPWPIRSLRSPRSARSARLARLFDRHESSFGRSDGIENG
jgi:hypothetical protein